MKHLAVAAHCQIDENKNESSTKCTQSIKNNAFLNNTHPLDRISYSVNTILFTTHLIIVTV